MPETDILNPVRGFDRELGDSMNPNYGFSLQRPATGVTTKAVGGPPYWREMSNTGHSFSLTWTGRTLACARRLKWYYEQYEDGFFTIIDWDGGGRHYVGHFTTPVTLQDSSNDKWDVQNVTFEEVPGAPMVQYPSDWDHDAVWRYPFNDYTDQKLAITGAWTKTAHTFGDETITTMDNPGATAGDWAQYEYRGYGFQLQMLRGPEFGQVDVYLDGTLLQMVDLYAAADLGPQIVLSVTKVSLNFHRVKVVMNAAKNASATATAASWCGLQVMR